MLRKAIVIIAVLLIAFSASAGTILKVGSSPPSFSLPNLDGKTVSLDNYLGRDVVILSFFASWSKSCQKEIEFLQDIHKQYKNKNLKIFGISYDRKTEPLKKFMAESEIDFDILHDKKLTTLKDYRILIIPTLFVIDQSGNIKSIYVDFDKNVEQAVSKELQKLLPSK